MSCWKSAGSIKSTSYSVRQKTAIVYYLPVLICLVAHELHVRKGRRWPNYGELEVAVITS